VKLVKFDGKFDWHHHEQEDELFLVVRGMMRMGLRAGDIDVGEGEFIIVPKGIEHCPEALGGECHVLLLESKSIPTTHDLGDFEVRRVLPSRHRRMVGPFIFVDEFGPATLPEGPGMGVRPHPHINLATVTYLFEGAIDHRDSLGTFQTIRPGSVNLMTAGRGIVHSERSPLEARDETKPMFGMQTWLALPDGMEEMDPAFENVVEADLPLINDGGVKARIIMGSLWG